MKNLILLFALFLIVACQKEQKQVAEIPTSQISGTIENPKAEKIYFYTAEGKLEAALVEGKFDLELNLKKPSYIRFKHGPESSNLYLQSGQKLQLTLDTEAFDESIKFTGEGSTESNYLASKYLLAERIIPVTNELYASLPAEFARKVAEIRDGLDSYLKQYEKSNENINKDFLKTEAAQIKYQWANSKLNYPRYFKYYNEESKLELDENYDQYLSQLDLDNGDLMASDNYKSFLSSYLSKLTQDKIDENPGEHKNPSLTKANLVLNQFKDVSIKDYLLFNTLKYHISNLGTKDTEALMALFEKECKDEKFKSKIAADFKVWENLAVGKTAPNFTYQDIDGKAIALSDLKGKFVYIDVWATWCGPCKREMPHMEKLQKQYAGNENLVFAAVSIDEDKEAWKKMVKEKDMMGVQLIADKAWKSSIATDYKINGIPRFMLIDKEGKIFDVKAPRPSSDKIKEILADITSDKLTSMN